jgi:hypothetical protein
MSNYTLDIISHHPQFSGKSLKKYYLDGIETVGAWGNEPFEIRFKNNAYQKVQVKISVDGTDVFTGKPADTNVASDMWVVNGYGTLSLKAWPENNNGGAAFVFTSANNSVAIHTHGDLSSRGIIAAAVFTEGHVEPIRLTYEPYVWTSPIIINNQQPYTYPTWYNYTSQNTGGLVGGSNFGVSYNSCSNSQTLGADGSASMDYCEIGEAAPAAADSKVSCNVGGTRARKSLESLAAVGAGQHVDQKISYVTGLIKPVFSETVRVRYIWWDDLVADLRRNNVPSPHADGFPGDHGKHNHINLGNTPRLPTHGSFSRGGSFRRAYEPVYDRV